MQAITIRQEDLPASKRPNVFLVSLLFLPVFLYLATCDGTDLVSIKIRLPSLPSHWNREQELPGLDSSRPLV